MTMQQVLVAGKWKTSEGTRSFSATNPVTGEKLAEQYPISPASEIDAALTAAVKAFHEMRWMNPEKIAAALDLVATRLEARSDDLCAMAHAETGLPIQPRLAGAELPRTVNQLRQAAAAARERSWSQPTIDSKANIRSQLEPMGPVAVFGPNNFPFAFNGAAGGDFAAALATGCPVICKANSSHPGTTRLLAEEAFAALTEAGLPEGAFQCLYRMSHDDGMALVADARLGAVAYTGSREAGLKLKESADSAGIPIYLELSSINPVVILPGAIEERGDAVAADFTTSCLMGTGQFCTNPGLVLLIEGDATRQFIAMVEERFKSQPAGVLLSKGVADSLAEAVEELTDAGAEVVTGGHPVKGPGFRFENTLLTTTGRWFEQNALALQAEAFGNCTLFVVAEDAAELLRVIRTLQGNLTGSIYSANDGRDDALYEQVANELVQYVGRLLNDKMPTGVAVSPAMNHGGPYPATGHAGFTAVGIPAAMRRFGRLVCYDNVRPGRLPDVLRDANLPTSPWRYVNGQWSQADV